MRPWICLSCLFLLASVRAEEAKKITGPYSHANLTIFLIHGADESRGKNYLTLTEALEQKKVIVHETGNVNELTIEATDPKSGTAEFKAAAVRIEAVREPLGATGT